MFLVEVLFVLILFANYKDTKSIAQQVFLYIKWCSQHNIASKQSLLAMRYCRNAIDKLESLFYCSNCLYCSCMLLMYKENWMQIARSIIVNVLLLQAAAIQHSKKSRQAQSADQFAYNLEQQIQFNTVGKSMLKPYSKLFKTNVQIQNSKQGCYYSAESLIASCNLGYNLSVLFYCFSKCYLVAFSKLRCNQQCSILEN